MDAGTWLGIGTLVTAIVGLALIAGQLREQRRAMRAEFGNLYVERYWQIDDDLLIEHKGTEKHKRHRHRYLRLFEDEFDVESLGFLDKKQWQAWHSVLDDPKHILRVIEDLEVANPAGDQFSRLRACIRQRRKTGTNHDPKDCQGRDANIPEGE